MNDENTRKLAWVLIGVAVIILAFNAWSLSTVAGTRTSSAALSGAAGGQQASVSGVIPTGIPAIYGKELGISFDDVSPTDPGKADATIKKLSMLDVNIKLSGADKERFINAAYHLNNGISCEYCCGARAIIFENGEPACGCAHSYAMRGLAKYLITEHGSEFTDEEIQAEMGKWKVLFFPGIHEGKAQVLQENGIELNYINLASNKYRGIEQGKATGNMVGGC